MSKNLTTNDLKNALIGGTILGGGGGGSMKNGETIGIEAFKYGTPQLFQIEEIPEDSTIITVSAVGAPAATEKFTSTQDYINVVKELEKTLNKKIDGIITNENGGNATINGWLQSAYLNIPLIDAPCNGRAHPTGVMGSMNLSEIDEYISYQSYSGGNPDKNMKITGTVIGSIEGTSKIVRQGAIAAGGVVVVARNPVKAKYVKKNAALGGISQSIEIGEVFYKGLDISCEKAITNVCDFLNGEVITSGIVSELFLETKDGFDVGFIKINNFEVTFWNEYMTLEKNKIRIATFPDLIMTFNTITGFPITSAEITLGMNITIINVKKDYIKLSTTMQNKKILKPIENIIGKNIF